MGRATSSAEPPPATVTGDDRRRAWLRTRPFVLGSLVAVALLPVVGRLDVLEAVAATVAGLALIPLAALRPRMVTEPRSVVGIGVYGVLAMAVLRDASGGALGGYGVLFVLPVVWVALYGGRHRGGLALVLAVTALALAVPLLAWGGPEYPAPGWRQALVLVVAFAIVGDVVRGLVGRIEAGAGRAMAVVQSMTEGLGVTRGGTILEVNDALCRLTGFSREELVGASVPFPFWPEDRTAAYEQARREIDSGAAGTRRGDIRRKDGTTFPAEFTTTAVEPTPEGEERTFVSTIRDVTDRERAERADREAFEFVTLLANLTRTVAHADPEEARRVVCRAAVEILGTTTASLWEPDDTGALTSSALVGLPASVPAVGRPASRGQLRAFATGERAFHPDLHAPGVVRPQSAALMPPDSAVCFQPILDGDAAIGVLVLTWTPAPEALDPGTERLIELLANEASVALTRAARVAELEEQADTDALTGLLNRRAFRRRFAAALAAAASGGPTATIALLDLDHFKAYNDTHGHPAGDRLLRGAAAAWRDRLRETDTLARWGGEEFCVLLPGCDAARALVVIDALRALVPDGQTCSAGVAEWRPGVDGRALLAEADAALYAAKHAGRDRTVVHAD